MGGDDASTTGALSNGFGDVIKPFDYGETQQGKHILRKAPGPDIHLTYVVSAEVHATAGIISAFANVDCQETTRWIDINTGQGPHNLRTLTGNTITWLIPSNFFQGTMFSLNYPEAIPLPGETLLSDDINVIRKIDYGIHAVPFIPIDSATPVPIAIPYQGSASQEMIPNEIYNYSLGKGSMLEKPFPHGR